MSAALPLLLALVAGPPDTVDTSDEAVRRAVADGVAFLIESQNDDGSWGGVTNATMTSGFANPATYHCWDVGTTALASLALLELGEGAEAADVGPSHLLGVLGRVLAGGVEVLEGLRVPAQGEGGFAPLQPPLQGVDARAAGEQAEERRGEGEGGVHGAGYFDPALA